MMKKRVLMPLLVAGMMMAFVVSLDSCKKNQTSKAVFTDTETPVIEEEVSSERGVYDCPYCGVELHHGDEHWHYFGTPKEGFDINEMMPEDRPGGVPHFWGVADCLDGLSAGACNYSGALHDLPQHIQEVQQVYLTEFGIVLSDEEANALLEERFHAHHIVYRSIINGGMANTWHVGGGVPGWPDPHPENP